MSWENLIETAQWTTIFFLFFKGAKNEVRLDRAHENVEFLLFTVRDKLGVWKAERKDKL